MKMNADFKHNKIQHEIWIMYPMAQEGQLEVASAIIAYRREEKLSAPPISKLA